MTVEDEGGIKQTFVSNSRVGKAKRTTEQRTWRNNGPQVVKACPSTEIKALVASAGFPKAACVCPTERKRTILSRDRDGGGDWEDE